MLQLKQNRDCDCDTQNEGRSFPCDVDFGRNDLRRRLRCERGRGADGAGVGAAPLDARRGPLLPLHRRLLPGQHGGPRRQRDSGNLIYLQGGYQTRI